MGSNDENAQAMVGCLYLVTWLLGIVVLVGAAVGVWKWALS